MKAFTREEVANSNNKNTYLIINGDVFDVTDFKHPGGEQILKQFAGKDVTKEFYSLHKHAILQARKNALKVGTVVGFDSKEEIVGWEEISPFSVGEIDMKESPYYNETHIQLRKTLRKFLWDSGTYQWCNRAELDGDYPPQKIRQTIGKFGLIALAYGKGDHLNLIPEPNIWSICKIPIKQIDSFHSSIINSEFSRFCTPGCVDAIISAINISVGPLLNFNKSKRIQDIAENAFLGNISISLGVTEPLGGTDVANVRTLASKLPNGNYLINGSKKFITGICHANYCTTLARMDNNNKLSVFVIPIRNIEGGALTKGISIKQIPASYSPSAGTGLIIFENVQIPSDSLLGVEGQGLEIILHNFNLERLTICNTIISRSRRIIEEAFLWTAQREAFRKHLNDMPVVRIRLGELLAELSVLDAAYERLLYRYSIMSRKEQNEKLGGPTALLKYSITRGALHICDQVVQIFGGRACVDSGMAENAFRVAKSFKILSVGGGTEDAMLDLGVRQVLKTLPKNARL